MFKLEALQALHGDCLLLQWGTDDAPHLMLIDGGPNTVYRDTLRPRLVELIEERGEPLVIDLMMLSHIDDDHINGLLDFAKELDDNRTGDLHGRDPLRIKVRRLWHNSLEGLLDDPLAERATASVTASIDAALQLPADDSDADTDAHFHGKVLASVPQVQELHRYAVQLGWRMNTPFDEPALVMRGLRDEPVTIAGLAMDIVAPAATEVEALRIAWKAKRRDDGPLAAYRDRSPYNLSSIVVLASFDGRRMLLTGDARGDHVLAGLEANGLLDDDGRLHVDLLKLPHHGSKNNVTKEFFERVTADHYVVSGDRGKFPNPAREAMEWLHEARGEDDYTVHCTYEIEDMRALFGDRLVTPQADGRSVTAALESDG